MRSAVPVAMLLVSAALLAGCTDGGGESDFHVTCPDGRELHSEDFANTTSTPDLLSKCTRSSTGTRSNTTSQAPNQLPNLVLSITDAGGNATPVTVLDGNLTFSARGSTDPDGQVAGIAVTVTDRNATRTGVLYNPSTKAFTDVTFVFDRAGPVNVTVAMVDDRAGFAVNQTHVYVNEVITSGTTNLKTPAPQGSAADCDGPLAEPLVDNTWSHILQFTVLSGVTWIEATVLAGEAAICAPNPDSPTSNQPGISKSEAAEDYVATTPGVELPAVQGTKSYFLTFYGTMPDQDVGATITVHYEPDTRAASAE